MAERMGAWAGAGPGAGAVGAEDVEQADQRQRGGGDIGRQAVVLQVAGHVHADEDDLEAAESQPAISQRKLGKGLAQRGARLCCEEHRRARRFLQCRKASGTMASATRRAQTGRLPAEAADQPVSTGTIRNWPNEPAAAATPIAQALFGATLRPITP